MTGTKYSAIAVSAVIAWAVAAAGEAAVTGVGASPNGTRVPVARAASVTTGWSVTTNSVGAVNLRSSQGVFRTPSAVTLGTIGKTVTQAFSGPGTAVITERVLVPADVIRRAQQAGATQLIYERSFDDDGGAMTGQLTLNLTTAAAASFSLSRLDLSFDDGKPLRVVARGASLKPRAEVTSVGAGMLQAVWEIAGPDATTTDTPDFRPLATVTRALNGGDPANLVGPTLPTDVAGTYSVRLRVEQPDSGFEAPVLRYVVADKNRN